MTSRALDNARTPFMKRTVITASGTHNYDPLSRYAEVEVLGAGASGFGSDSDATGAASVGGGGGAGGYAKKLIEVNGGAPSSATIVVGAKGVAAANSGNAGGNSSYNDTVSTLNAYGGGVGSASNSTILIGAQGGAGGGADGGDINVIGAYGELGISNGDHLGGTYQSVFAGRGGNSLLGVGGGGAHGYANSAANWAAGGVGAGYGAGGGGSFNIGTSAPMAGGNGCDGIVIITEYA